MSGNRRRFTRVGFAANAKFITESREIETGIIDLSLKGALVEIGPDSYKDLALDQKAQLSFTLTASTIEVVVDVTIKRLDEHLMGLMFNSIDIESAAHLKRLVELNIRGEDMIEREIGSLVAKPDQG